MLFSQVPRNLGLYFTVNEPLIYWIESNATIIAVCGPRDSIRRLVGCVPLPRLKLLQLFIAAHLDFYVCFFRHKKKIWKKTSALILQHLAALKFPRKSTLFRVVSNALNTPDSEIALCTCTHANTRGRALHVDPIWIKGSCDSWVQDETVGSVLLLRCESLFDSEWEEGSWKVAPSHHRTWSKAQKQEPTQ